MSTHTIVRARIDAVVKAQATEALEAMGLSLRCNPYAARADRR